ADDGFNIAAHVADFRELCGFNLDEGRVGQLRQPAGDLGLADPGRPDHEDVLGNDFVAQRLGHLLTAPAIAQRDSHGTLGLLLPDDMLVEFGDDFSGSHVDGGHGGIRDSGTNVDPYRVSTTWFWLV